MEFSSQLELRRDEGNTFQVCILLGLASKGKGCYFHFHNLIENCFGSQR